MRNGRADDLEPLDLHVPRPGAPTVVAAPPRAHPAPTSAPPRPGDVGPPQPPGRRSRRLVHGAGAVAVGLLAVALVGTLVTEPRDDAPPAPSTTTPPPTEPPPDPGTAIGATGWALASPLDAPASAAAARPDGTVVVVGTRLGDGLDAAFWLLDGTGPADPSGGITAPGDQEVHDVAVGPGGVAVAVGVDDGHPAVWRQEAPGAGWERVLVDPVRAGALTGVAADADGFLAVDASAGRPDRIEEAAGVLVSADGLDWVRVAGPPLLGPRPDGVAADPEGRGFVVFVRSGAGSWSTADGLTWQRGRHPDADVRAVGWAGDRYLAAGVEVRGTADVVRVSASVDGAGWDAAGEVTPVPARDPGPLVVAGGPGGWVLGHRVDGHAGLLVSADRERWTPVDDPAGGLFPPGSAVTDVVWQGTSVVAVGTAVWAWSRPDPGGFGGTGARATGAPWAGWAAVGTIGGPDADVRAADSDGVAVVAVGSSAGAGAAWASTDGGVTWAAGSLDGPPPPGALVDVAWLAEWFSTAGGGDGGTGRWVAVADGAGGGVWTSTDGTSWSRSPGPFARAALTTVAFDGGEGLLVAGTRDDRPVAWSSRDGVAWEPLAFPEGARGQVADAQGTGSGWVVAGTSGGLGAVWRTSAGGELVRDDPPLPLPPVTRVGQWGQLFVAHGPAGDELWQYADQTTWGRVDDPTRVGAVRATAELQQLALAGERDGAGWVARTRALGDPALGAWEEARLGPDPVVALVQISERLLAVGRTVWAVTELPLGPVGRPATDLPAASLDPGSWPGGWAILPASPLDERWNPAVTWTDHGLFVWGGAGARGGAARDGVIADVATGTWRPVAPAPIEGRVAAAAVWTGTHVIVWGGYDEERALWDGAAYDPATDTWTTIPATEGALSPFSVQPMVWTGAMALVPSVGVAWDPGAGAWVDLPPDPARVLGYPSTGWAWTGRELVVVGGVGAGAVVAEALDPATGTWRALPDPPRGVGQADGSVSRGVGAPGDGSVVVVAPGAGLLVLEPGATAWTEVGLPISGGCGDTPMLAAPDGGWLAVASCGQLAVRAPDGGWLVRDTPVVEWQWLWPSVTVVDPPAFVAWVGGGLSAAVWTYAPPPPGALGDISLGPVRLTVDLSATRTVTADRDDLAAIIDPDAAVGAGCRVDADLGAPVDAVVAARLGAPGAEVVVVRPAVGGPGFRAVATRAAAGAALVWGQDGATTVTVTCPTAEGAAALARQLAPPDTAAPIPG